MVIIYSSIVILPLKLYVHKTIWIISIFYMVQKWTQNPKQFTTIYQQYQRDSCQLHSHIRIDIGYLYLEWLVPTTTKLGPKCNYIILFLDLLQLSATLLHHMFHIQHILMIIPILVVSLLHNPILIHNTLHGIYSKSQ